jgi:hypothetical protein
MNAASHCGDVLRRLDPGRARDADGDRLVLDPVVIDRDLARAQAVEGPRAVELVVNDCIVDRHERDREVVPLRIPDVDADLALVELDAANVELVRLGRILADQLGQRSARSREERDGADQ